MVVPWPRFDAPTAAARNSVTKQFNDEIAKARYTSVEPDRIVGLGIEYVLTTQVRPVFNVTEKRAGVLGERMNVNALGRRAAELESVKAIAGLVLSAWLEADAATEGGPIADGRGSVVFPQHLRAKLAAQLGASEQTPDSDAAREELSSLASRDDAGIRSGSVEAAHADAPSRNLRS